MLKYIVIELDDTSTSYCHYENTCTAPRLIDIDTLKAGILFSMKQNLYIQFLYPKYDLPDEYKEVIESIDHIKIKPSSADNLTDADFIVVDGLETVASLQWQPSSMYIFRVSKSELSNLPALIQSAKDNVERVNVVLTDIDLFTDDDFATYQETLKSISDVLCETITQEKNFQVNLLSDRLMVIGMRNCNAGDDVITLAPNGKFYICPAFYHEDATECCGDIHSGLCIKNKQLYKLDYAPICRNCDAYHCKRCVWLNRKLTLEVNTPSHEQCVISHLERNTAKLIYDRISASEEYRLGAPLPEIDYLDPFEVRKRWQDK